MNDEAVEIFKGRDARDETIARLRHPTSGAVFGKEDLEGQFRIATVLANATEAMPKAYRKQPGAVLLALAWSVQHDVDILTAIQSVAFIEGKAVVDATMQRALAKRAGYELSITVAADGATVGITQGDKRLGEAGYTMDDARAAGLADKQNWKRNPQDMLVARATTRAIRRFAPDVLLGMLSSDEIDETPDVVELAEPMVVVPLEQPVDEPTQEHPAVAPAWTSAASMRGDMKARGISLVLATREAHAIAERLGVAPPDGSLDAIFRHPDPAFVAAFTAWVRNHDVQGEPT